MCPEMANFYCTEVQEWHESIAWMSRDGKEVLHESSRMAREYCVGVQRR